MRGSVGIFHFASSDSGTWHLSLSFARTKEQRAADERYISAVSRRRRACRSNSVASSGASAMRRHQLRLLRLRVAGKRSLNRTGCIGKHAARIASYQTNRTHHQYQNNCQHHGVFRDVLAFLVGPELAKESGHVFTSRIKRSIPFLSESSVTDWTVKRGIHIFRGGAFFNCL